MYLKMSNINNTDETFFFCLSYLVFYCLIKTHYDFNTITYIFNIGYLYLNILLSKYPKTLLIRKKSNCKCLINNTSY